METTNFLLEMIKDTIHHFRFIIILLIALSAFKTCLTLFLNFKMAKLQSKNNYEMIVNKDGTRAIKLTTSEKIDLKKMGGYLSEDEKIMEIEHKKAS